MAKRVLSIVLVILGLVCGGAPDPCFGVPMPKHGAGTPTHGSGRAQPSAGAIRVVREELPNARIEVTGKGYPSKRNISETRRKLLAKRAAILDAYRLMNAVLNGVSGYIVGGEGVVRTSGFIKGAEISSVRYFPDGKVEVDLTLPVVLSGETGKKR